MNKRRVLLKMLLIILTVAVYAIESSLPNMLFGIQGARIGFANVLVMIAMFSFGNVFAYIMVLIKCIFGPIAAGTYASMIYSISAGLVSLSVMVLLKEKLGDKIGYIGISIAGAFAHNVILLTTAAVMLGNASVLNDLPDVALAAIAAGAVTGSIVFLFYRLKKMRKNRKNSRQSI